MSILSAVSSFFSFTRPSQNTGVSPPTATISKLLIYPVKSCRGIELDEAILTQNGFKYDREWLIVDAKTNEFCIGRKNPKLLLIRTALEASNLCMTIPATPSPIKIAIPADPELSELSKCEVLMDVTIWGDRVEAYAVSKEADRVLSEYLGKEVRLVRVRREEDAGFARPSSVECVDNRLDYGDSTIVGQDQYPLTIATLPSLYSVQQFICDNPGRHDLPGQVPWTPERAKSINIERYRPNIVLDSSPGAAPLQAWDEDAWTKVKIGGDSPAESEAVDLLCPSRIPRCLVTNVNTETGEKEKNGPYELIQPFRRVDSGFPIKPCFAISAVPLRSGGKIRVGSTLTVVDTIDPDLRVYRGIGSRPE